MEGAALRGARALGRGASARRAFAANLRVERERGKGREGQSGSATRLAGGCAFSGENAACEPSSERRRRARGRSSSARRRVDAPRATRGIAPRGSGRARGDEARRVCRWDGVGRRGTHLASFASASKRAGEARRRRTRVWAPLARAPARAPGATYAAFFSAMHMVFEGLFRRSDDEARGDVGLGCGNLSARNARVERFATWPPNAGVQFPSRSVRPGLAPQNTSTKSDRVETALHHKLRFRRFRVSKHKPLKKTTRVKENCRPVSTRQSARVVDVAAPQPAEWAEASASEADALFLNFFSGVAAWRLAAPTARGDPAPRVTSGPPRDLTHARSRPFRANIDCYKYTPRARPVWVGSGTVIVVKGHHHHPSRPPTSSLRVLIQRSSSHSSAARLSPRQTYASSQLPPSHARPAMIASSASHASSNVSTQPMKFMRRTWLTPPTSAREHPRPSGRC